MHDESVVESIARVAHEVNRAYCLSMGDESQLPWEDAPEWQQKSARNGVRMHLSSPDITPAESHAAWLKEKLDDGWTYGAVKDVEKKTHPCCVPFEKLKKEDVAKDYLFRAVVKALGGAR